uniref:Uncharacterized protein n=1 Tax=Cannabis sativa TaxID=3483 RepID=A0A803P9H1_CANSA
MEYVQGEPTIEEFSYFYDIERIGHDNDRLARFVLDPARRKIAHVLSGLPIQDCDYCVLLKNFENIIKLILENARLQQEPYKEPSEKPKERIDNKLQLSIESLRLELRRLLQSFCKRGKATLFLHRWLIRQRSSTKPPRKGEEGSKDLDLLRKQNSLLQESVKKLKLEAIMKDKEINDLGKAKEQVEEKVKVLESRVEELGRYLENEKEIRKKKYDQAISNYVYTTFIKLPDFDFVVLGAEVVEMADAFRAMSPTKTQGLGGNIFLEDAKNANVDDVTDGVARKVADDPNTPTA